jgi:hypothetical protein
VGWCMVRKICTNRIEQPRAFLRAQGSTTLLKYIYIVVIIKFWYLHVDLGDVTTAGVDIILIQIQSVNLYSFS